VFLNQLNLQPCRGCYVCQSRGEQYCPIGDQLADLVGRMKEVDGVIFVSPVYTANVSALMKNLMDRLAYTAHRPAFLGKPAMSVATASSYTSDTLKALSWFGYTGFEIVSRLGVAVWPTPHRGWRDREAVDRRIEKAVRRFEKALFSHSRKLRLRQVIFFYVMKATAETDPAFFRADYAFHQLIDQLGFRVSGWKKALGRACYAIASCWMNRRLIPFNREKSK
jgi:NAD(P)H-dependent FMN reductase